MAKAGTAPSRSPLLKQFSKYVSTVGGLDLTLRLIHSFVIIAAAVSTDKLIKERCEVAVWQLAVGRRYLRLFAFMDCFQKVYDLLSGDVLVDEPILKTLALVESTCYGMWLLIENTTMLHDMTVWTVSWYTPVLIESNKFWVYGLCASITSTIIKLSFPDGGPGKPQTDEKAVTPKKTGGRGGAKSQKQLPEKPSPSTADPPPPTRSLLRKLALDCCDMALPTSFLGWIHIGDARLGTLMAISSLLMWPDFWEAAQK